MLPCTLTSCKQPHPWGPNQAGLDPVKSPAAFGQALARDLETLFCPPQSAASTSSHAQTDTAGSTWLQRQQQLLSAASTVLARQDWQGLTPWLGLNPQQPIKQLLRKQPSTGQPHAAMINAHDDLPGGHDSDVVLGPQAQTGPFARHENLFDPSQLVRQVQNATQGSAGKQREGDHGADAHVDTWILPVVQYGAARLRQDEACTVRLMVWPSHLLLASLCCLLLRYLPALLHQGIQVLWACVCLST